MAVVCSTCDKKLSFFYLGFFKPWYACDVCGQYHCYDCDKQLPPEVESSRHSLNESL